MSLTCISCKLLFSVPQLHQEHYKTDWHRYNLKRRLAELPPLTEEDFNKRAAAFKADCQEKDQKNSLHCDSCNKYFSSRNALSNHVKSKKHFEALNKSPQKSKVVPPLVKPSDEASANDEVMVEDDEEWSDENDAEWESCDEDDSKGEHKRIVIDTNDCLFCDFQANSTEGNVTHMTEAHSFFIPDVEYLIDLDGLIASLAAKIHLDRFCLWCNGKGKGFRSLKSVKQHMLDKGHCKMLHEGEALLYYAEFYDYSPIEDKDEENIDAVEDLLEDSDYELVLPSGATIGHRSLSIYYKQNLKPLSSDSQQKVKKVLHQYKSLGYTGCTGQVAIKRARDINYMKRIKDRYHLKLGLKQNKFQPHFRNQVMF